MPWEARSCAEWMARDEPAFNVAIAEASPKAMPNDDRPPPKPISRSGPDESVEVVKRVTGNCVGNPIPDVTVRPLEIPRIRTSITTSARGCSKLSISTRAILAFDAESRKMIARPAADAWNRLISSTCCAACPTSVTSSGVIAAPIGMVATAAVWRSARVPESSEATSRRSLFTGMANDLLTSPSTRRAHGRSHSVRSARTGRLVSNFSANTTSTPNSAATCRYASPIWPRKRNAALWSE